MFLAVRLFPIHSIGHAASMLLIKHELPPVDAKVFKTLGQPWMNSFMYYGLRCQELWCYKAAHVRHVFEVESRDGDTIAPLK